jgi:hypothetical protein
MTVPITTGRRFVLCPPRSTNSSCANHPFDPAEILGLSERTRSVTGCWGRHQASSFVLVSAGNTD